MFASSCFVFCPKISIFLKLLSQHFPTQYLWQEVITYIWTKFSIHKKTIARYLVWLSTAKSPGGDADLIFFFVLIVFGFCCKTETNSGLWKLVFITAKKKEPITGSSKLLFQNLELRIFKFQLLNELKFWLAINFQFINKVFFSGENKLP